LAKQFNLNEEAVQYLKSREDQWKSWAEDQFRNGSSKVVSELEASRSRLSNELQTVAEKNMELEMQLSQLKSSADPETEKALSSRERNQLRMQKKFESLQQRLEQLVFVHRQLLRKYAALELDVAEDKKKISLRDERIAQVFYLKTHTSLSLPMSLHSFSPPLSFSRLHNILLNIYTSLRLTIA
jgi:hypothetical protein